MEVQQQQQQQNNSGAGRVASPAPARPQRRGQQRRKSGGRFSSKPPQQQSVYLKSTEISATGVLVRAIKDVIPPFDGTELHDPRGFILSVVDKVLEKQRTSWSVGTDILRINRFMDGLKEIIATICVGLLSYLFASSQSTYASWMVPILNMYRDKNMYVDEGMFDILNAFMPVERCVQLNCFDVLHRCVSVVKALESWELVGQYSVGAVNDLLLRRIEACVFNNMQDSELHLLLRGTMATTTMVMYCNADMLKVMKMYPMFKYNVYNSTVNGEVDIGNCAFVYTKMESYQHDFKPYYWKLKKVDYTPLINEGRVFSIREGNTNETKMLVKVNSTFRMTVPQVLSGMALNGYLLDDIYDERNEVMAETKQELFVNRLVEMTADQMNEVTVQALQAEAVQIKDETAGHQRKRVMPRKSETEIKKPKLGVDFKIRKKATKLCEEKGRIVKLNKEDFVWYEAEIGDDLANDRFVHAVRSYVKAKNIKSGSQLVLSRENRAILNAFVERTSNDLNWA